MVENVSFHVCCIILKKREMMSLDNVISSYLPMFDCKNWYLESQDNYYIQFSKCWRSSEGEISRIRKQSHWRMEDNSLISYVFCLAEIKTSLLLV